MMVNEFKKEIKILEGKKIGKYYMEKEKLSSTEDDEYKEKSLKEELKDLEELKKYLNVNNVKFIENFELLDYRDSGGESNVYTILPTFKKQKVKTLNRKAILKIILNKNQKENKKEYLISYKLKNQNIINNYGYSIIKQNESSMIIMDDARFGNIRNFQRKNLKRTTLPETFICYLAYQILNGIKYIHQCNVAHMDIKLQNIVIDEYLTTKLIDFSISIDYKDKKPNDIIELPCKGTNFYMPKEVLESKKIKIKDLQKVDLYAFGVILYNLAFGNYPYGLSYGDEDNFEVILKKIKEEKIEYNNIKSYSSYFLDFLTKLLEKDINKRISIKEAENHYWIQGAKILLDEKEQYYNLEQFASHLLTDYFKLFNDYIHNYKL